MLNLIAVIIFTGVCLSVLAAYYLTRQPAPEPENGGELPPVEAERESFLDRWERAAVQAGLGWRRNTYIAITCAALAAAVVLAAAGHANAAIVMTLAGPLAPYLYVRRLQAARSAMFVRQLPSALFLASSVLRAGGTLMQAVDSIASEMPDPISSEFKRIQQKMRLQVPAHEAMSEAQERIGVREFAAVVVAARITAEVGGNLAHIFDQISRSIVESQNARRTVQSFTTEGRMSANLMAGMPFVVLGLLHFLSPGYFGDLFTTWGGRIILALCLGAIALGRHIIRRMVDIRMF